MHSALGPCSHSFSLRPRCARLRVAATAADAPVKRKRGRPKKVTTAPDTTTTSKEAISAPLSVDLKAGNQRWRDKPDDTADNFTFDLDTDSDSELGFDLASDSDLDEPPPTNGGSKSSAAAKSTAETVKQRKPWDMLSAEQIQQQNDALQTYAAHKTVFERKPASTKHSARSSQDNALIHRDEAWLELEKELVTQTDDGPKMDYGSLGKGQPHWYSLRVRSEKSMKSVSTFIATQVAELPPLDSDVDAPRQFDIWLPKKLIKSYNWRTDKMGNKTLKWQNGQEMLVRCVMDNALHELIKDNPFIGGSSKESGGYKFFLPFSDRAGENHVFPEPCPQDYIDEIEAWGELKEVHSKEQVMQEEFGDRAATAEESNRMDTRPDYVEEFADETGRRDKRTGQPQRLRRYKDDAYRGPYSNPSNWFNGAPAESNQQQGRAPPNRAPPLRGRRASASTGPGSQNARPSSPWDGPDQFAHDQRSEGTSWQPATDRQQQRQQQPPLQAPQQQRVTPVSNRQQEQQPPQPQLQQQQQQDQSFSRPTSQHKADPVTDSRTMQGWLQPRAQQQQGSLDSSRLPPGDSAQQQQLQWPVADDDWVSEAGQTEGRPAAAAQAGAGSEAAPEGDDAGASFLDDMLQVSEEDYWNQFLDGGFSNGDLTDSRSSSTRRSSNSSSSSLIPDRRNSSSSTRYSSSSTRGTSSTTRNISGSSSITSSGPAGSQTSSGVTRPKRPAGRADLPSRSGKFADQRQLVRKPSQQADRRSKMYDRPRQSSWQDCRPEAISYNGQWTTSGGRDSFGQSRNPGRQGGRHGADAGQYSNRWASSPRGDHTGDQDFTDPSQTNRSARLTAEQDWAPPANFNPGNPYPNYDPDVWDLSGPAAGRSNRAPGRSGSRADDTSRTSSAAFAGGLQKGSRFDGEHAEAGAAGPAVTSDPGEGPSQQVPLLGRNRSQRDSSWSTEQFDIGDMSLREYSDENSVSNDVPNRASSYSRPDSASHNMPRGPRDNVRQNSYLHDNFRGRGRGRGRGGRGQSGRGRPERMSDRYQQPRQDQGFYSPRPQQQQQDTFWNDYQ